MNSVQGLFQLYIDTDLIYEFIPKIIIMVRICISSIILDTATIQNFGIITWYFLKYLKDSEINSNPIDELSSSKFANRIFVLS